MRLIHHIKKNLASCIRLIEHIACKTANISAVPQISILQWTRLAITVFARIPECRSWDSGLRKVRIFWSDSEGRCGCIRICNLEYGYTTYTFNPFCVGR